MVQRYLAAMCASLLISGMAVASSEYEQVVASLNPVHWWRFHGPANSPTVTDSVGDWHGAWHNGLTPAPGIADPDDPAAKFWNNGPTWGVFDHSDSLLLAEGTIAFTMYDTTKINEAVIFSKDADGYGDGGHLSIGTHRGDHDATGSLWVRLQSDSDSHRITTGPIHVDTRYHVVFTFGPGGMKLYLDGVLVDENEYDGGILANLEPLVLGASTAYSSRLSADPLRDHWSGVLDDVIVFGTALEATQVVQLYQRQLHHVPEPAGLAVLALGAALLTRRARPSRAA